jgi:hypothetical protein
MPNNASHKILWWLCLFFAPLVLLSIELFHPAGFRRNPDMFDYLSQPQPFSPEHYALDYFGPQWWFILHMIQTPLVCLVAGGRWLMGINHAPDQEHHRLVRVLVWGARFTLFIFMVYYTVLDAIGGIGLGRSIVITETLLQEQHLSADQLAGIELVLNKLWTDPWVGGVGSVVSETRSWAIFLAALLTSVVLYLRKMAPWPSLLLLLGFGWVLQISHASYHGPVAFGFLILAGLWIWRANHKRNASAMTQLQ